MGILLPGHLATLISGHIGFGIDRLANMGQMVSNCPANPLPLPFHSTSQAGGLHSILNSLIHYPRMTVTLNGSGGGGRRGRAGGGGPETLKVH